MSSNVTHVVAGDDLRHVEPWAQRLLFDLHDLGSIEEREELARALAFARDGWAIIELSKPAAELLFDLDFRAHGYGTRRALRSTRADCAHCAALGRALEALLPRLAVQRLNSAGRLAPSARRRR